MSELPRKYGELMRTLKGLEVFQVTIDDGPMLRDLVRLSWEIARDTPNASAAVRRIESLVLGNLAGTFTFRRGDLETWENPPAPIEQERWLVGRRSPSVFVDLNTVAPGRYTSESHRLLSTQIAARIGDCPIYALTFGIIMISCDLCTEVVLVGNQPHAWVRCHVKGEEAPRHIDLSARSHGRFEENKQPWYDAEFAKDETTRLRI